MQDGKNGYLHYRNSRIYQYSLGGVFIAEYESCQEAGRKNYIYPRSIEKCCRGEVSYSGDSIWKRVPQGYPKDNIVPIKINKYSSNKPVGVRQFTVEGVLVKEFKTLLSAAKELNIDAKAIRQVLKGKQKLAGGFHWEKI